MLLADIITELEKWAPLQLQESYDNSGLQVGDQSREVNKALITIDVTEDVINEAKASGCQLIISHHPLIFSGIKKLTGSNYIERCITEAIKNNIAIYSIHTNLDNISSGVNGKIAEILGLQYVTILSPMKNQLRKLITYCPKTKLENGEYTPDVVRQALWDAGAGNIGNYKECSFNLSGIGTYRAEKGADPFIGEIGKLEKQAEERIEVIFPQHIQNKVIAALWQNHPYEEVAYDIFSLENEFQNAGAGIVGQLEKEMSEELFLDMLKEKMNVKTIRHTPLIGKNIKLVAVCGGSGSFLLKTAIGKKADVFITGDFKYHQFFDAEGNILVADIGHYESEQFTVDLIFEKMNEIFPNFALLKSKVNTNPINYL